MSAIQPVPDAEVMRQVAIAAALLDLYRQREQDDYSQRAEAFNRTHTATDVIAGLLAVVEYLLASGLDEDEYAKLLRAWQLAAEVDAAVAPVLAEGPREYPQVSGG